MFLCAFAVYYIQEDFLQVVHKETILVGHSLENDLLALKITHDLVIDTAVLYKHSRGGTYKIALRVLTRKFLSREIQDSENGHDSIEDARATMELALLKIRHGKFLSSLHILWHAQSMTLKISNIDDTFAYLFLLRFEYIEVNNIKAYHLPFFSPCFTCRCAGRGHENDYLSLCCAW